MKTDYVGKTYLDLTLVDDLRLVTYHFARTSVIRAVVSMANIMHSLCKL